MNWVQLYQYVIEENYIIKKLKSNLKYDWDKKEYALYRFYYFKCSFIAETLFIFYHIKINLYLPTLFHVFIYLPIKYHIPMLDSYGNPINSLRKSDYNQKK